MAMYRWNTTVAARAFDAAAGAIHPLYAEIQAEVLTRLRQEPSRPFSIVDAGGGSGKLLERILEQFPKADAVIVDQSEPFLALAAERLERFGRRAKLLLSRLQAD